MFNKLTDAQSERLYLLIEECGETIQAATKILRHGYDSHHPETKVNNLKALEREVGDLFAAVTLLVDGQDLDLKRINAQHLDKLTRVRSFLHHQTWRQSSEAMP